MGESGGCEPEFALKYTRRTVGMTDGEDTYYDVYCKAATEYMQIHNTTVLPEWFVGSSDIAWIDRVLTQGAMQAHVDTAISSTVNLPQSATQDDIAQLYLEAWKQGCKGITIFRDGCKRLGILTTDSSNKIAHEDAEPNIAWGTVINTSDELVGMKRKLTSGCGNLHVMAYFDPESGDLREVFLSKGSTGGCQNFMIGLSRMISMLCRAGVDVYTIKDQLDSCGVCPSYAIRRATKGDTSVGSCCPMAIGNALIDMYEEMNGKQKIAQKSTEKVNTKPISDYTKCPECGAELRTEGGCRSCPSCGFSYCH